MNNKTLYSLLYKMLRIRLAEEKIAELYPEQEMRCPVHLSIREEAIAASVCGNLKNILMTLNKYYYIILGKYVIR